MGQVVPLKPLCITYEPGAILEGGAQFVRLRDLKEVSAFWFAHRQQFTCLARGRRWGSRQQFLNPGEWIFAPHITALVRAVTRWHDMGIRVQWEECVLLDPEEGLEYARQAERLRRLLADMGVNDSRHRYGFWQLKLPASLRNFPWFTEYSNKIHYPGLTPEQAAEIFQLRTFEDWRQSNMREVDFMLAEELDDLIRSCWDSRRRDR